MSEGSQSYGVVALSYRGHRLAVTCVFIRELIGHAGQSLDSLQVALPRDLAKKIR
jgi:hypothetical protein